MRRTPRKGIRSETPSPSTGGRSAGIAIDFGANPDALLDGAAVPDAAACTSLAVTRPPRPVAATRLMSMPSSFAIRRTAGVASAFREALSTAAPARRTKRSATASVPDIVPTTVPASSPSPLAAASAFAGAAFGAAAAGAADPTT